MDYLAKYSPEGGEDSGKVRELEVFSEVKEGHGVVLQDERAEIILYAGVRKYCKRN